VINLQIVKEYLKHRLKAKTRHGLHSPFVYRLVDNVFYDFSQKKVVTDLETSVTTVNQPRRSKKLNRLLYRIINDRQPKNIVLLGNASLIEPYLKAAAPDVTISYQLNNLPETLDVVIIDAKNDVEASKYFDQCLPETDEHTLIILKNIYCTKSMKTVWHQIKAKPKVTVTVDLFSVGLIYFRKGQVREDFWIRF
jgi:hypothetical protein